MTQTAVPRSSTTHNEMLFHVRLQGHPKFQAKTIFARREGDEESSPWWASVAYCVHGDQFVRQRGKTVARRHYFQDKKCHNIRAIAHQDGKVYPSFDDAANFDWTGNGTDPGTRHHIAPAKVHPTKPYKQ